MCVLQVTMSGIPWSRINTNLRRICHRQKRAFAGTDLRHNVGVFASEQRNGLFYHIEVHFEFEFADWIDDRVLWRRHCVYGGRLWLFPFWNQSVTYSLDVTSMHLQHLHRSAKWTKATTIFSHEFQFEDGLCLVCSGQWNSCACCTLLRYAGIQLPRPFSLFSSNAWLLLLADNRGSWISSLR